MHSAQLESHPARASRGCCGSTEHVHPPRQGCCRNRRTTGRPLQLPTILAAPDTRCFHGTRRMTPTSFSIGILVPHCTEFLSIVVRMRLASSPVAIFEPPNASVGSMMVTSG